MAAVFFLAPPARAGKFFDTDYGSLGWYLFKGPIYPPRYMVSPTQLGYSVHDPNPTPFGGQFYREYYNYGVGYGFLLPVPSVNYGAGLGPSFGLPPALTGPHIDAYGQYRPHLLSLPAPPPPTPDPQAHFLIRVPPDAELWLDGVKTGQTGPTRVFLTPALEPGEPYVYTVCARWSDGGRVIEQSKDLVLHAGDWVSITFPTPAPTPPAEPAALPGEVVRSAR